MKHTNDDEDHFVDKFSRIASEGNAAWFLGAGVSIPAGAPTWQALLQPLAKSIGLSLRAGDDLPAIAQYVINYHSGNRGAFVRDAIARVKKVSEPTRYHRAVARSGINLIWSTNYDNLMEIALDGIRHEVRSRDEEMTGYVDPKSVLLIKAHGSVRGSTINELVISTEDFEDYSLKRAATVERLRADLLSKSFLFVGYGYGDPNIRTAVIEARRLSAKAPLRHFMLTPRVAGREALARQQHWSADLRRVGISCLLTDDHDHTLKLVERIGLRSRGPTIYATGSHLHPHPLAKDVGRLLAHCNSTILLDGQSSGTSRELLSSFQQVCVDRKIDVRERLRYFPNPYAVEAAYANDPKLIPMLKQWRATLLRQAHTVLAFHGQMGTAAEISVARDMGCQVIPIPAGDGPVLELLKDKEIANELERRAPGYLRKARKNTLTADDIMRCVLADLPS